MLFPVTSLRPESEARTLRVSGYALNKHIIRRRPLSTNSFEATGGPNLWFSQCPPCLRGEFWLTEFHHGGTENTEADKRTRR